VKRSHGLLLALGIVAFGALLMVLGALLFLPGYVERRVVREARARGVELTPGEVAFGLGWVQLSGATAKLVGAPGFEARMGLVDISLEGLKPSQVQLSNVQVGVSGSLPRVLLELGEWTRRYGKALDAPLVASRVSVRIAEGPALPAWLELSGGVLTRTVAGAAFSAQSCKLSGFELGKVGAGYTTSGSDVSIGFGDTSAQVAPLRLDAHVDGQGAGKLAISLAATKLGLLGRGLGIAVPLPEVVAAAHVELELPPGLTQGEVSGTLSVTLTGFVPPHPPELDGFVFGDTTTFDTALKVDAERTKTTLTSSKVKAGRFELTGGGHVLREGLDATLELDLKGKLPCDALAGAAAESRLGRLLGRASGTQARRTALAVVRGDVSVEVGVKASTRDPSNAQLSQKIGVGCGLRPLSLGELLALTPNAKDLQAIGGEVGKKLTQIGKDLGLPAVPKDVTLPTLPDLTQVLPAAPPGTATQKKLAAPVPSG
jgi:ADP-dependent NAD(P)H-hydrate dehydratase / NAD(P)H-hydrate epimerase